MPKFRLLFATAVASVFGAAALTAAVAADARRNGVIVLTCGTDGNVLRFLPPLTIGEDLLNEALDVIAAAFEATR